MKSKIGILILCLFCQFCFGQILTKKTLHCQLINDSYKIENGIVFNVNSKIKAYINSEGFFEILAKAKDTLLISSLAFKPKKIVLTEKDFSSLFLRIRLDIQENKLNEVVILKNKEIKSFDGNSQKYVDIQFFDDQKSSPKNRLMPSDGTIEYGMNFVRIFKMLSKLVDNKGIKVENSNFISEAPKIINHTFFTKTLNLKEDEVGLFLIFCENDSRSKKLLKPESEFLLMDFLISKNREFKRLTTFEK